jgi:hypothetical protein
MKKIILTAIILGFISTLGYTQISRPAVTKSKTDAVKVDPVPTPTVTPVYSLTSARVIIKTGSDNKEFLSSMFANIWLKGHQGWAYDVDCLFQIPTLKNEFAVNSTTDLGFEKLNGYPPKLLLSNIQKNGLELNVWYFVNFFMDAWKIENVSLTLEFRDQNGNLHPTMGTKIISFTNAVGFLSHDYVRMKCTTDQNLNPLVASIQRN